MELLSKLFSEKRIFKEVVEWAKIRPIFLINPILLCNRIFSTIFCIVPIFCQKSRNFKNLVFCNPYKFSLLGKNHRNRI
jgi:hypothetical protein